MPTKTVLPEGARDLTTGEIAAEIRAELGRLNRSRAELARDMGVSQMWMSDRLNAKVIIDIRDLFHFAEALGVHVFDLMPRWIVDSWEGPSRPKAHRPKPTAGYGLRRVRRPADRRPAGRPDPATPPHTPGRTARILAPALLEQGTDLRVIQEVMRHSSLATTEIYTKVVDARRRAAVHQLPAIGPRASSC